MTTYEFAHTETTTADADAVWALWGDVARWAEWDSSLTGVTLEGPFDVGSAGVMNFEGRPPVHFRLTEVRPGQGFSDETEIPGAVLRFHHEVAVVDGLTAVTHRVEIEGALAERLGPVVTADVPDAVRALVRLASSAA
ncbi:hypothetical protein [Alloactinosynnema sp. L-07]|uniref:SRPBCC family protein n=1 Tax=Alloactinosynnema sp. L-07 TaxID=1653480 RepID=UPI00065F0678|nr:SRPBCC family protein [Alloactinosynnema sp. L-07]CRK56057.1 hypothetical protein [Alloactinosynnema sp. L-07]